MLGYWNEIANATRYAGRSNGRALEAHRHHRRRDRWARGRGGAAPARLRGRGLRGPEQDHGGRRRPSGGPQCGEGSLCAGLKEALHRNAFEPTNMVSIKWDDASLRQRTPLKAIAMREYGAPYMTAHRAHIQGMLHDALPQGVITLDATCVGADTRGATAVARFADGREVEADVIVGADGI